MKYTLFTILYDTLFHEYYAVKVVLELVESVFDLLLDQYFLQAPGTA